jgi:hypothetical protein
MAKIWEDDALKKENKMLNSKVAPLERKSLTFLWNDCPICICISTKERIPSFLWQQAGQISTVCCGHRSSVNPYWNGIVFSRIKKRYNMPAKWGILEANDETQWELGEHKLYFETGATSYHSLHILEQVVEGSFALLVRIVIVAHGITLSLQVTRNVLKKITHIISLFSSIVHLQYVFHKLIRFRASSYPLRWRCSNDFFENIQLLDNIWEKAFKVVQFYLVRHPS